MITTHCGIYKITNNIDGKCYIGQSINIEGRWEDHKKCGNSTKTLPNWLYRAMKKHGVDNFTFEVIEECPRDKSILNAREIYWIAFYKSNDRDYGYNMTSGGEGSFDLCEEAIERKKESLREGWKDNETRRECTREFMCNQWKKDRETRSENIKKTLNTEAGHQHLSDAQQAAWDNPEIRAKRLEAIQSIENRNKVSLGILKWYAETPGAHEYISQKTKEGMADPKLREHLSELKKGKPSPNKGHKGERTHINNGIKEKIIKNSELDAYLSEGWMLGRICSPVKNMVKINNGITDKYISIDELDYWLTNGWTKGSIHHTVKGRIYITNGKKNKMVYENELDTYLSNGWLLGLTNENLSKSLKGKNKGRKYINNGVVTKFVKAEEYDAYIAAGWMPHRILKTK